MPMLSPLPHLFNAEPCQTYLHTLRWKERPLPCRRGQSHTMGQWGTSPYRPGCQRSWCHRCTRTCNDLPDTLLPRRQRPLASWMLATLLVCLACASRRRARDVGVQVRPSSRWGWGVRNAALS
jgi:hypothetical protein